MRIQVGCIAAKTNNIQNTMIIVIVIIPMSNTICRTLRILQSMLVQGSLVDSPCSIRSSIPPQFGRSERQARYGWFLCPYIPIVSMVYKHILLVVLLLYDYQFLPQCRGSPILATDPNYPLLDVDGLVVSSSHFVVVVIS
jgi:hypothetical protein